MAGMGRWLFAAAIAVLPNAGTAHAQTYEQALQSADRQIIGTLNRTAKDQNVYIGSARDAGTDIVCDPLSTVLRDAFERLLTAAATDNLAKGFKPVLRESEAARIGFLTWRRFDAKRLDLVLKLGDREGRASEVHFGKTVSVDIGTLSDEEKRCVLAYRDIERPGKVRYRVMLRAAAHGGADRLATLAKDTEVYVARMVEGSSYYVVELDDDAAREHRQRFGFVAAAAIELLGGPPPPPPPGPFSAPPVTAGDTARKPGDVFQDTLADGGSCKAYCPEMVVLPAGSFVMGSSPGEGDSNEQPQHRVTIGEPFAVGKHEVTFAELDECVIQGGCRDYQPPDSWGRGRMPVINVSWEDAQAYVTWLSKATGQAYRLLSEAEWEFAARGITDGKAGPRYGWGDEIGKGRANCNGCGSQWDAEQTAPVGSFPANRFGLHDMHGNVWEWVADVWHDSYAGAPVDGTAWSSGGEQSRRVVRGGSRNSDPGYLRAAFRSGDELGNRNDRLGFRAARMLSP